MKESCLCLRRKRKSRREECISKIISKSLILQDNRYKSVNKGVQDNKSNEEGEEDDDDGLTLLRDITLSNTLRDKIEG